MQLSEIDEAGAKVHVDGCTSTVVQRLYCPFVGVDFLEELAISISQVISKTVATERHVSVSSQFALNS